MHTTSILSWIVTFLSQGEKPVSEDTINEAVMLLWQKQNTKHYFGSVKSTELLSGIDISENFRKVLYEDIYKRIIVSSNMD